MSKTGRFLLVAGGTLFAFTSAARADSGTALMMGIWLQLFFGNAILGALEGILIAWVFKVKRERAIGVMILANYVSMFAWVFAIDWLADSLRRPLCGSPALYNIWILVAVLWVLSFLATLILEWPFCLWAMKGASGKLRKSLKGNLLVQTASYAILVPLAIWLGGYAIFTDVTLDPSVVTEAGKGATVFFISQKDGDAYRINLDGSEREKVADLDLEQWRGKLRLIKPKEQDSWDLRFEDLVLLHDVRVPVVPPECTFFGEDEDYIIPSIISMDPRPVDYRPEGRRNWDVRGYWALHLRNQDTSERFKVSFDTPFDRWRVSDMTVLPDDRVVFQFGDHICLLDLTTRRVGVIAMGRSPIAVPKDRLTPPTSHPAAQRTER